MTPGRIHMTDTLSPAEREELVAWRRDFHAHPELAYKEIRTSNIVAAHLDRLGYEVRRGVGGTGVVGLLPGKGAGKTLMIRADMDCLPIHEENSVDYVSTQPGCMHACGHDGHTAVLMMLARKLAQRERSFAGNIKLVFQPAEEGGNGALAMIKDGALQDPPVDHAIGLHLYNNLPVGKIGLCAGPIMAGIDELHITIEGVGGHAAFPQQTVDPVVVSAHVITALQTIVSRNVDPLKAAVVTIGMLKAGDAFNVIPGKAEMKGTVRYFDPALGEQIPALVERIIRGTTEALGAKYELQYTRLAPPVVNNAEAAEFIRQVSTEIVGESMVHFNERLMGSEDMSYFLNEVPGCFFFVGSSNAERGLVHPHHSPRFDFDESAMEMGVTVFLRAVDRYFANGIGAPGGSSGLHSAGRSDIQA